MKIFGKHTLYNNIVYIHHHPHKHTGLKSPLLTENPTAVLVPSVYIAHCIQNIIAYISGYTAS